MNKFKTNKLINIDIRWTSRAWFEWHDGRIL